MRIPINRPASAPVNRFLLSRGSINTTAWELIVATFNGGIPILAPGILLLGTVIGLAALYQHPMLNPK